MSDTDFVATFLGPFGKFQLRSTLLIYLVKIPSAWFMACLIFTAKSPSPGEIFCEPPAELELSDASDSGSWIKVAHKKAFDKAENEETYDFCHVNKNASFEFQNQTSTGKHREFVSCEKFEHHPTFYSFIHQYETFCDEDFLVPLTQTFHLLGVLVGGIIAYYMLKKISPRRTMLIGMLSQLVLGITTGYAPTYGLHLFFRCAVAATCSLMCIGIMILTDITTGKYKVIVVCMFEQFWGIGVILLPLVTWLESWSLVYVAITLPTLLLLPTYFWLPDSPRWLLKNGNVEEAKRVLLMAAKLNDHKSVNEEELDKQLNLMAQTMKAAPPEAKWISIWEGDAKHKLRLFVAHLVWSSYLSLYFTYLLNVRTMGRNYLEVNTAIVGVCEILGTFIGLYLILNTKQKWMWASVLNIATSLIAFSSPLVPDSVPPFQRMVIYMFIVMLPTVTTSTTLALCITCFTELVTKEKKKICNYSGVTCSRTLVMMAPFIGYCSIYGPLVPQMMLSVINIVTALFVIAFIRTPRTLPLPGRPTNPDDSVAGKYINKAFVHD